MEIPAPRIEVLSDSLKFTYLLDKGSIGRSAEFKITWEEDDPNSTAKITGSPILSQLFIVQTTAPVFSVHKNQLPQAPYGLFKFEFKAELTIWSDTGFSETHKEEITHLIGPPLTAAPPSETVQPFDQENALKPTTLGPTTLPAQISGHELIDPAQESAVGSVFQSMSLQHRLLALGCWLAIGAICAATVIFIDMMDNVDSAATVATAVVPISIYFFSAGIRN